MYYTGASLGTDTGTESQTSITLNVDGRYLLPALVIAAVSGLVVSIILLLWKIRETLSADKQSRSENLPFEHSGEMDE